MNKSELISKIVSNTDFTNSQIKDVVDAITDSVGESLQRGEYVRILGFGAFFVSLSEKIDFSKIQLSTKRVVLIDACELFNSFKRFMLLHIAGEECFVPRWTFEILDETEKNLTKRMSASKSAKNVQYIENSFPSAIIREFEEPNLGTGWPDEGDFHLIWAAMYCRKFDPSAIILTENIKHFPVDKLEKLGLNGLVKTADEFMATTIQQYPIMAIEGIKKWMLSLSKRPYTPESFIEELRSEKNNLIETADVLELNLDHLNWLSS